LSNKNQLLQQNFMVDATNGGNEMLAMLIDKISKIEQLRVKNTIFLTINRLITWK
jgi:hypothetical protein